MGKARCSYFTTVGKIIGSDHFISYMSCNVFILDGSLDFQMKFARIKAIKLMEVERA